MKRQNTDVNDISHGTRFSGKKKYNITNGKRAGKDLTTSTGDSCVIVGKLQCTPKSSSSLFQR
jgi:hypothetical protein